MQIKGEHSGSVIKKLTSKWIIQLVEVQMELRERISDGGEESEKKGKTIENIRITNNYFFLETSKSLLVYASQWQERSVEMWV